MACFIAPMVEGAVVSIVKRHQKKKEETYENNEMRKFAWHQ